MRLYIVLFRIFFPLLILAALAEIYQEQLRTILYNTYANVCRKMKPFMIFQRHRKPCNWERAFLISLSLSLFLALLLCWIGRFGMSAETDLGYDEWFFEGLRVVFSVFEGDSIDFRHHTHAIPMLPAVLAVLVPFSAVGTALMLLWDYLPHHIPWFNRVWYIFSELEPNSIRMAKSIQKGLQHDTGLFIFLRTPHRKQDLNMLADLQGLNYFLYPKDETHLLRWYWRRRRILRFFFLSENTDQNFKQMKEFLDSVGDQFLFSPAITLPDDEFQHELYLLSETESAPILIDHLRNALREARYPFTFQNTELQLLDRFRATSYDLLKRQPLHKYMQKDPTQDSYQLNVLILGFGRIGREFFQAASSMGVIHNCTTKFTICDLEIDRKLNAFLCHRPELGCSVHFHSKELDAETDKLDDLIRGRHFHYILVALGDDERNIRVTSRLKIHYRQLQWARESRKSIGCRNVSDIQPQICVNIEDSVKHAYTLQLWRTEKKWDRSLHVFGGLDQAFTKEVLMPENLWKAARWIHRQLNQIPDINPLKWNEYERRSSIACAAHAEYHVAAVCADAPNKDYAKLLDSFTSTELDNLYDTEHLRWMAYVRSEGLRQINTNLMEAYFNEVGNHHVDTLGKLTPCLVDSNKELDALWIHLKTNHLNHYQNKYSFRDRDKRLVLNADAIKHGIETGSFPTQMISRTTE